MRNEGNKNEHERHERHGQHGLVLVVVMWALMALIVLAFELSSTMRIEALSTLTYEREIEAYYLAQAGFHRALHSIVRAGQQGQDFLNNPDALDPSQENSPQDIWLRGDGRWVDEEFGAGGYQVRVNDESGKININTVEEAALREIFNHLEFDPDLAQELADAILDWRDPDPLERLNGVESDYYLSLPIPYPAKDGPFDTPDELLLVRGITPELFYQGLGDVFTVYGASQDGDAAGQTNLMTAGPLVLQAILGIGFEEAQELAVQRADMSGADASSLLAAYGNSPGSFSIPTIMAIESVGFLHGSQVTRRIVGVAERLGTHRFRLLRWQDWQRSPPEPPSEG